jgi:hypothetical protein
MTIANCAAPMSSVNMTPTISTSAIMKNAPYSVKLETSR